MRLYIRAFFPFIMPAAVLAAAVLMGGGWAYPPHGDGQLEVITILLPQLPYVFLGAALLLGWRFHQSGMFLSAWLLGVSYGALHHGWYGPAPEMGGGPGNLRLLICLVSIEIPLFSVWRWRRLPTRWAVLWLMTLVVQTTAVAAMGHMRQLGSLWPQGIVTSPLLARLRGELFSFHPSFPWDPVFIVLSCSALYLMISGLRKQDVLQAGLLGAILAVFIGLGADRTGMGPPVFFSAAGLILLLAGVEASFFMAYRDELTGVPSRRALNQALRTLGRHYAIAMIDVDHFKKFNDTYGHKTGDQVLKLLASQLLSMSGGAQAFRYGGEEFTVVFPGKSVADALPHLDACRRRLSETPFTVRAKSRKKASALQRGKGAGKTGKQVRVTVSVGAAGPSPSLPTPSQVILAADKALYRAKRAGRNCVKT